MLNKNIEEDFRVLKIITESIYETLQDIKKLEINNQNSSLEYEEKINSLKSSLELEQEIYERIPNSLSIIKELQVKLEVSNPEDASQMIQKEINDLVSKDANTLIKRRIFNKLKEKLITNIDIQNITIMDFLENKDLSIISSMNKKDMYNTFLAILNTYLTNSEYKNIQDELISLKYDLIFMNDYLNDFLDNKFQINEHPYWESAAISDLYEVPQDMLIVIRIILIKEILINNIIYAMKKSKASINDLDYVISESLIRTSFLFLDEERGESFKNNIREVIKNNDLTIEMILAKRKMERIFNLLESDKLIPVKISLKK